MSDNKKTLYAIVGPTGTGKTEVSIQLAEKYLLEIISADSRLVYKYMDIGTAKPTKEEKKDIPHYMIDLVEPNEQYSVGVYKNKSEEIIADIFSRDKIPCFVGGTGLYLNSVLSGLSIPKVEPDKEFRAELSKLPAEKLHSMLSAKDPVAASKIHQNDGFRLVRALEVIEKTGQPFSELAQKKELPFNVKWIGLTYEDRDFHTDKLKQRAKNFLSNGFIDEVKSLVDKYGELDIFKYTIGYCEALQYIKGEINQEELVDNIALTTRQFAKRQRTWFRANKEINWITLDNKNTSEVFGSVDKVLLETRD